MNVAFSELDFLKPELGAEYTGQGTHFAVFSAHAEKIELCLFSEDGSKETARLPLPKREGDIWSGYIEGLGPGTLYGYRAYGPYDPQNGHRFNPNKLLLDPYAKQVAGEFVWDDALFGYTIGNPEGDLSFDERDSAPFMVKGVVQDPNFDWDGEEAIRRPWTETIIYETHLRGMTMTHPGVPDELRGTFLGMASDPIIDHLMKLGVSAVELLPVQYFLDDRYLIERNLRNYWGYQPLGYFAPHARYMKGTRITEFKAMVKRFHAAGIEVLMDVVYNHTAEGSEQGPTLSFRGLDNLSYYRQSPEQPRHTYDMTGTGNTLNVAHPMVLRMVLDSLRYWVGVMHIDGFRFDLASALGREYMEFDREGGFLDAIRQDPMLAGVKLIAEPWDIGDGGYQLGGFPPPFREWNDRFRDDVRRFWKGDGGVVPVLAERLTGSPVQFNHSGRAATTSVNLLSAHDGFTLMDTVSYTEKHNEGNGEDNRDGHSDNHSDNMGAEGPTDDPGMGEARRRRRRAMVATLMMSQGVPMILGGDELGNSQGGNNNAYCQDNEIGWIDWSSSDEAFLTFCRKMTAFRRENPVLRQENFLEGATDEHGRIEIAWYKPDGSMMDEPAWGDGELRILGVYLCHLSPNEAPAEEIFLVFNAGGDCDVALPPVHGAQGWRWALNTAEDDAFTETVARERETVRAQSVAAFVPQDSGEQEAPTTALAGA
ncbi:glycogen debranching protein GlgX [Sinorhizobium sp. CCBAU 05631]|uniref:glycogen debranching protein GlgX n=1 Tax=Sinorhizobium sp. CCBAU 05631 TaxID=794846 RepID=UPI000BACB5FB|nr:glycogen debranching protein GlgX [Sinorhizobium sp. CCBAU 05631]ASY60174.1 Glycogen debranching enzyme [Sinorhizobium sp. CCBAU 05631]